MKSAEESREGISILLPGVPQVFWLIRLDVDGFSRMFCVETEVLGNSLREFVVWYVSDAMWGEWLRY